MLASLLVLALSLLTLFLPSHCGFLTSAPLQYARNSSSPTLFPFTVSFLYTNTTLLVTSPQCTLSANLSDTIITASITDPHFGQALLLPDSPYGSSPIDVFRWCQAQDTHRTSTCTIPFTLTAPSTSTAPTYSTYFLTNCLTTSACNSPSSTDPLGSSLVSLSAPQGSWSYFLSEIDTSDLNAQITLSPPSSTSSGFTPQLWLASEFYLFDPFFSGPIPSTGTTSYYLSSSTVVSGTSISFLSGLYIIGVYVPLSASLPPVASYTLQLLLEQSSGDTSDPAIAYGYNILSVLALILAAALITLVLMRVCLVYKRRQALLPTSVGTQVRLESPIGGVVGEDGVVREWERQRVGLSDEEVAALPVHRFTGAEKFNEGRCPICLDDFALDESLLTTLRCGHSMHHHCAQQWLKRAVKCPLCQQSVREGDDKEGQQRSVQVEMVALHVSRPTALVVPLSHAVVAIPLEDPSVQRTLRSMDQLH